MVLGQTVLILVLAVQGAVAPAAPRSGLALDGEAAEHFLATAKIVKVTSLSSGVTRPQKVELDDGQRSCLAAFKCVDEHAMRQRFADGSVELQFSDSYTYEIAAYELDKLLGTGLVPPAVERVVHGRKGALSLWVDDAITEWERLEVRKLRPPDIAAWNDQTATLRLFLQLIYDTDCQNLNNLLVTADWKLYKIDASRAFRAHHELLAEMPLERFSRRVLAALTALDRATLDARLGRWLDRRQLDGLWARRGLILERAAGLAAERGEAAVFFD